MLYGVHSNVSSVSRRSKGLLGVCVCVCVRARLLGGRMSTGYFFNRQRTRIKRMLCVCLLKEAGRARVPSARPFLSPY